MSENNGTNNVGGEQKKEKKTLKQRGHEFAAKHPKGVKYARRIGAGIGLVVTAAGSFFAGRKSVKPTYITVTPIEPEEPAQQAEEPTEPAETAE